jgi:hypothetical protein
MYMQKTTLFGKWTAMFATAALTYGVGLAEESLSPAASVFQKDMVPFLKQYCYECHGIKKQKADVDFENLPTTTEIFKDTELWELTRDLLLDNEMPPEKSPQPGMEDKQHILDLIDLELERFDCDSLSNPGRVTIRRLNRAEYDNTIRDLLGVNFQPSKDFPLDEVGYGFDNIGDVLSLSPILMEKYLNAAESVVTNAILSQIPAWPPVSRHQAEQFTTTEDEIIRAEGPVMGFYREGSASKTIETEQAGEFKLIIRAYGQQAGPDHAKLEVAINEKDKQVIDVDAFQEKPRTYTIKTNLAQGANHLSLAYLNNYNVQDHPVAELNGDRNLFVDYVEIEGPLNVERPALPESHTRIIPGQPERGKEIAYAGQILKPFAKRAWRRPVSDRETERLTSLVAYALKQKATFEESIQVALQAILTSPSFLFRWELDPTEKEGEGTRQLNEYELASRLSYFLWSSMPDEELFALADEGRLSDPEVLKHQVERMIQDPKSDAFVTNFAGQWLQFRSLDTVTPDPTRFPTYNDELRQAMQRESELFFSEIMRTNRSLTDFLDADFTYLNETLARHYGMEGVQGKEFQRVSLDADSQRGGVLTQASVLTLTSNPTRTSPVLRGKWILEQIMGTPPPPPPPDAPLLEETEEAMLSGSLRERMEKHRIKPDCATCHEKMDPIGFAFENFNAVGEWRDLDEGFPIDPSGKLPDGTEFDGPKDLIKELMKRDTFVRSVIEKMLTFALGRGLEYYDQCTVDEIYEDLSADHLKFQTLIQSIVLSKPFQLRNLEGDAL